VNCFPCRLVRQGKQFTDSVEWTAPLDDPCRLVRQGKQFAGWKRGPFPSSLADPCRLARQAKEFGG
jgi:hypothetical protein